VGRKPPALGIMSQHRATAHHFDQRSAKIACCRPIRSAAHDYQYITQGPWPWSLGFLPHIAIQHRRQLTSPHLRSPLISSLHCVLETTSTLLILITRNVDTSASPCCGFCTPGPDTTRSPNNIHCTWRCCPSCSPRIRLVRGNLDSRLSHSWPQRMGGKSHRLSPIRPR
jgi:hypothetical protein